jgi:hypothetical protein
MDFLPLLLGTAVLAPLASFFTILLLGRRLGRNGEAGAYVAVSAIIFSAICSYASLGIWLSQHFPHGESHHAASHDGHDGDGHDMRVMGMRVMGIISRETVGLGRTLAP